MENIYNKLIERLQENIDQPAITKIFKYSIEDLQDNPDKLKEIVNYLKLHEGKYTDFNVHTWIDEETMRPIFMLQLYINESLAKHLVLTRLEKTIQYLLEQKEKTQ